MSLIFCLVRLRGRSGPLKLPLAEVWTEKTLRLSSMVRLRSILRDLRGCGLRSACWVSLETSSRYWRLVVSSSRSLSLW